MKNLKCHLALSIDSRALLNLMSVNLLFVESLSEVQSLKSVLDKNCIVVTTNATVEIELKKNGVDCRNTIEFFGPEGHQEVIRATESVVAVIRPSIDGLSHKNVKHAFERTATFWLRFFLNYIFSHIYIVNKAVNITQPNKITCLPFVPFSQIGAELKEDIPLLGNILKHCGSQHDIQLDYPFGVEVQSPLKTLPSNLNSLVTKWFKRKVFNLMLLIYRWKVINKKIVIAPKDSYGLPTLLKKLSGSAELFLPVYIFSERKLLWKRVSEAFCNSSFSFFGLPETIDKQEAKRFENQWSSCLDNVKESILANATSFQFCGTDVSMLVIEYVANGLADEMRQLNGQVDALNRVLAIKSPNSVFAQHALGVAYALGEICRNQDIPAILISHGSHISHSGEIAEKEWNEHARTMFVTHYPFVAVQTQWAERFLKAQTELISKPLITGPLIFAQKSRLHDTKKAMRAKIFEKHSNKKILLHAGTPKRWRAFRPWVYETVEEYIKNINHLIIAVQQVRGVHLAIRYRSNKNLTTANLRQLLINSDCYEIYDSGAFNEHLLAADMLVSYSSTTIEEALKNKIPVLQFDPDAKYWHIPSADNQSEEFLELTEIQCASTPKELTKILKLLSAGKKKKMYNDRNSPHTLNERKSWRRKLCV